MRVDLSHQVLHSSSTMSTAYKTQAPPDIATMDEDYDYSVDTPLSPEDKAFHDYQLRGEPPPPPPPAPPTKEIRTESEDALLDLAQLEELHQEAERMKALGNKHMAAQVRSARIMRSCKLRFNSPITLAPNSCSLTHLLSQSLPHCLPSGVYASLQRLFCCLAAVPRRTFISRVFE